MFYSDDMIRLYIEDIDDLLSLKKMDIKIYNQNSRTEEQYYKWEDGYICSYDKNGMTCFNTSFPIDEYNYIYTDEFNLRRYNEKIQSIL
jgi:hypothetical protein